MMNERRYWGRQCAALALTLVMFCVACGGVAKTSEPGTSRGGTSSADTSSVLSAGVSSSLPKSGSGTIESDPGQSIYEECGVVASCENDEITGMYGPLCLRLPKARCELGCRQQFFDIVVFEFDPRTDGEGAARLARAGLCNQSEGGAGGDVVVAGDTGLGGEGGDRNVAGEGGALGEGGAGGTRG